MSSGRDCHNHHNHSKVFSTSNMKLTSSASEQNVYFTYVCLVDDINPTEALDLDSEQIGKFNTLIHNDEVNLQEEPAIQVERTTAFYELVDSAHHATECSKAIRESNTSTAYRTATSGEENDSDNDKVDKETLSYSESLLSCDHPNVLQLTKMKWLTEDPNDSGADSSSPSMSSITSNTSTYSKTSDSGSLNDKYLSTILRLDKEHNMFGLSSIAIIGPHQSKQKRAKDDERAVFHQTAIVQVCCKQKCCKHISKTDLPPSLKCGVCRSCCFRPTSCTSKRSCYKCDPCPTLPPYCCSPVSSKTSCICRRPCGTCKPECAPDSFGLKIKVHRKSVYAPPVVQLTPRNSSVLQKPLMARTCHHTPECIPPSDCFPFLMPCFWPASTGSPCSEPARCFHNPPCPRPRTRAKVPLPSQYRCPKGHKCVDAAKHTTCPNEVCPGNIPQVKKEIESRFGKGKKEEANHNDAKSKEATSKEDLSKDRSKDSIKKDKKT